MPLTIQIKLPSRKRRVRNAVTKVRNTVKAVFARIWDRIMMAPRIVKFSLAFVGVVFALAAWLYISAIATFFVFFLPFILLGWIDFGFVLWYIAWMLAYMGGVYYGIDVLTHMSYSQRTTTIDARSGRRQSPIFAI